jgi:hypothetical protein
MIQSDDAIALGEIIIPSLNIVQGVGDLCALYNPGQIVFAKEFVLADAPDKRDKNSESTPAVQVVILGFRPTRFAEKVPGGEQGRIFASEKEVEAVGGTTSYKEAYDGDEQVRSYFQPLASAILLLSAPENFDGSLDETFPFEVGSLRFALSMWHMRGVAYTHAARPLKTARTLGFLRRGYSARYVLVTTKWKSFGKNSCFIPVVKSGEVTDPGVLELSSDVLGSLLGTGRESSAAGAV